LKSNLLGAVKNNVIWFVFDAELSKIFI